GDDRWPGPLPAQPQHAACHRSARCRGVTAIHRPKEETMHNTSRRTTLRTLAGLGLIGAGGFTTFARAASIKPGANTALIVVDVQNCFIPGGTLPVKAGDEIVPLINKLAKNFENVVITQDWHTPGHTSFASAHAGKKPFETTKVAYGTQVLWPDHCVQGTSGADFAKDLKIPHAELIIRKGYRQQMDSYSAFFEADGKST